MEHNGLVVRFAPPVKDRVSDNVGGVKFFLSALRRALMKERHFALVDGLALPTVGSPRNRFRSGTPSDPCISSVRDCDHDYYFELLFNRKRSRTPNQLLDVRRNTIAISGLSCVRTELAPLLIVPSLAHHPIQPNRQSSCHRYLRSLASTPHHQVRILAAPFRETAHCDLGRFHQQKTQHRTPLLGDVSQPSSISAGIFQWHQSEIARHLFPTLKAARISDDQYKPQCGEWTDTRMRHQPLRCRTLFHLALDRLTQFGNGRVQSIQQLQQIQPASAGPRSQLKRFQLLASTFSPQFLPA